MTNFPESSPPVPSHRDISLPVTEEPAPGADRSRASRILLAFLGLALIIWLLSGFYKVNADEVAIVERLGAFLTASEGGKAALVETGLHYHLPWPIDVVYKIPVQQTRTLTVDAFFAPQEEYANFKMDIMRSDPTMKAETLNALLDPYLVTADKNVVNMSVAVTYRIADPEAWLMTVAHDNEDYINAGSTSSGKVKDMREQLLQQLVQREMVHAVGKLPIDRLLFEGSEKVQFILTDVVTKAMVIDDASDSGTKIDLGIQILKADPTATRWPQYGPVNQAFQSVLAAKSEADRARYGAQSDADAARTQATAQQQTMLHEAEAYAKQVVDEAQGEANRFSQVYAQYEKAPDVTRWNVFAEAAKSVSGSAKRIMFVQPGQKTILTIEPPTFDAGQVQPNK